MEPMELMLLENNPRRRKRRRRNPSTVSTFTASPLLLAVAGYLAWCGYKQYKTGSWTWTPWKGIAIGRRFSLRRPNPGGDFSAYDRAVANMMRPADSVIENTKWTPPRTKRGDEETIGFIHP